MSLPIISNCDNCGACCRTMGTPPGFALFFPPEGKCISDHALCSVDMKIIEAMPRDVWLSLQDYYTRVWRGESPDRTAHDDLPCLWYDEETKRCRHHEHRPTICREFEVGEEACVEWRKTFNIAEPA